MSDEERMQLVAVMGGNIAIIDTAIKHGDVPTAKTAFLNFMGAAGFLAQEIDELNNATGN